MRPRKGVRDLFGSLGNFIATRSCELESMRSSRRIFNRTRCSIGNRYRRPKIGLETFPINTHRTKGATQISCSPPFDKESYEKDPTSYIETVEPGRIWQALPKGPGITPIARLSGYSNRILQGERVNLEVKTEPGAPATFYSPRLGKFDNELAVVTVRADENGVARATFLATPGTRGEIEILASSPVHSGMARFLVDVKVPRKLGAN